MRGNVHAVRTGNTIVFSCLSVDHITFSKILKYLNKLSKIKKDLARIDNI